MTTTFRGKNRNGAGVAGVISDEDPQHIADMILDTYKARWQLLIVERDGEQIGGVDRDPDTGDRIWWSE